MSQASAPSRLMWFSIAAAVATIALKTVAAALSGSVGLLSDALESLVNLVAAVVTLLAMRWAEQPADAGHPFGHSRGELLAALFEGALVLVAGLAILATAIDRAIHPMPMEQLSLGLVLSVIATVINGVVGAFLVRAGRRLKASAIEADGHHLLTDVMTSVGVLVGVGLVKLTGIGWFDPLAAMVVGVLVLVTAVKIVMRSVEGLVDGSATPEQQVLIKQAVARFEPQGVVVTSSRTRNSGREVFIHLTLAVPAGWSVKQAHDFADEIEKAVEGAIEHSTVETHVEPAVSENHTSTN